MLKRAKWGLALAALVIAAPAVRAAEGTAFHDFQPEKLKDCRKRHPFKLIDDPKMVSASDASAFLKDEEYVLGVSVNGESRAFPTRFIAWRHGANIKVGGAPVAVTYCNVCNTGGGFDLRFEGKPIQLNFLRPLQRGRRAVRPRHGERAEGCMPRAAQVPHSCCSPSLG